MRLLSLATVFLMIVGSLAGQTPLKPEMPASDFLKARYESGKTHLVKVAEMMPETDYGFRPTPETQTFGIRIAHVARMNFEKCAYLVGKPDPHAGTDLEKTVTGKSALVQLLKDSFAFCDGYMSRLSPQAMAETYAAKAPPGTAFGTVRMDLGGIAIDVITHNAEMYGYLAVYLRLKGLVPPTSTPSR
jgi:hypothetical protein